MPAAATSDEAPRPHGPARRSSWRTAWLAFAAVAAVIAFLSLATWGWRELPRYPGIVEHVSFGHDSLHFAGLFVHPRAEGPYDAVVFIHGSGPSTADDPIWKYHAGAFVRRGMAVLVYDKRGSGGSNGILDSADYQDLADDAASAVRYLRARSDVRRFGIGLLGRSEGGWVAPLVAQRIDSLAFIVFSAGPAVPQLEETLFAMKRRMLQRGVSEQDAQRRINAERIRRKADSAGLSGAAQIPFYDPGPALERLRVPLLALYADGDQAIPTDSSIAVLRSLQARGHDITIRTFPHVGHNFLLWRRPPIFAPGYLSAMIRFAAGHTAGGHKSND